VNLEPVGLLVSQRNCQRCRSDEDLRRRRGLRRPLAELWSEIAMFI